MVDQSSARRSRSVFRSIPPADLRKARGRRAVSQAVACTPMMMESLEARQLLAVQFNFTINDLGGTYRQYYERIRDVMQQAGRDWSSLFESSTNASIETEIQFKSSRLEPEFAGAIAFASPVTFQKTGVDPDDADVDIVDPGPLYEIKNGTDPNGQEPDAIITFIVEQLDVGFFDTSTNRVVPPNKLDVLSTAIHEIGHTIGFITLSNSTPGAVFNPDTGRDEKTSLGILLAGDVPIESGADPETGLGFTGTAAQSVYGSAVPFTLRTGAHYGSNFSLDPGDPGYDLRFNMMSPFGYQGRKATLTAIDAAVLADLGAPVNGNFNLIPTTGAPVLTIEGTTADDVIEVIATGNQLLVKRNFVTTTETFSIDDYTSVVINAGAGQDRIIISGAVPAVSVNAGPGNDTIIGGAGDDTIDGGGGLDRIFGNAGNDFLMGGGGVDQIYGGEGSDTIYGGRGNDYLDGDAGNDLIDGGADDDFIFGDGGNDKLFGSTGNDTISGGASRDTLNGGFGADLLKGGGSNDVVDYSDRTANLFLSADNTANDGEAGEGDNIDGGIEVFLGGSGDDKMLGSGLNNTLIGGEGNDTLVGGSGNDRLEGGSGSDALDGQAGDDSLVGGGGNDRMVGGSGADRFFGMAGNDLFYSKDLFRDSLEGGDGNDLFRGDDSDILDSIEGVF